MSEINLNEAKDNFIKLFQNLNNENHNKFFKWIEDEYLKREVKSTKMEDNELTICYSDNDQNFKGSKTLDKIAKYLRKQYPFGSKIADENILTNVHGINSNLDLNKTIEIDGFMYDEDAIDDLVDKNLISRFYCMNCNSSKCVKPYTFITHSVSRDQLYEIFKYYLNFDLLKDKQILDIGSRLGAFLYGCYVYSHDSKIIGIEINKDLCEIQNKIINKFKFNDRIKVINDNVLNCKEIVSTSDFIFMHNVFEFFLEDDIQLSIWKFLKKNIKKGTVLITIPSIKEMTRNLFQDEFFDKWLYNLNQISDNKNDEQPKIYLYEII